MKPLRKPCTSLKSSGFGAFGRQAAVWAGKPCAQPFKPEVFHVKCETHFGQAVLQRNVGKRIRRGQRGEAAAVQHGMDGRLPSEFEAVAGEAFPHRFGLFGGGEGKVEFFQYFVQTNTGIGAARKMMDVFCAGQAV